MAICIYYVKTTTKTTTSILAKREFFIGKNRTNLGVLKQYYPYHRDLISFILLILFLSLVLDCFAASKSLIELVVENYDNFKATITKSLYLFQQHKNIKQQQL
jgi:hypothetical protein